MSSGQNLSRTMLLLTIFTIVGHLSGCASWNLPRIDPSGQNIFLPANNQLGAANFGQPYGQPGSPTGNIAPAFGTPTNSISPANPGQISQVITAPPVYANAGPAYNPVASPGAWSTPAANPLAGYNPLGGNFSQAGMLPRNGNGVSITPNRVLAPVGSEVILKAGCCTDGHLTVNQRVEWLVSREGVGQIVRVNEQGKLDMFRMPWNTPRKIDNWYAVGATSPYRDCLTRGTADPTDDITIKRGEAWMAMTSATEGTSRVVAYVPENEGPWGQKTPWNQKRATATIYWVDAQWLFPQNSFAELGRSQTITTRITRQTDGTPVAGWLVRYKILGANGASLGYDGTGSSEIRTDANGQASIQVSPVGSGNGTTNIEVTLVRPAIGGPMPSPQLEIARGMTTVTWGAGQTTPTNPPQNFPNPPTEPAPTYPTEPNPLPGNPPNNPTTNPNAQPQFEVKFVHQDENNPTVQVRGTENVYLYVKNIGNAPARNIEIEVRFDNRLIHKNDTNNEHRIVYRGMKDLAPGEEAGEWLEFKVTAAGTLTYQASVTAIGVVTPATTTGQVTAVQPLNRSVKITKRGPVRGVVDQEVHYIATVTNNGDVPLENVVITDRYSVDLFLKEATQGKEKLPNSNTLVWKINRLEVGEKKTFEVRAKCLNPKRNIISQIEVSANGMQEHYEESQPMDILPVGLAPGAGSPNTTNPPAIAKQPIDLKLQVFGTRLETNARTSISIFIQNQSNQVQKNLELRVKLPKNLKADLAKTVTIPQLRTQINGDEVQFGIITELQPNERVEISLPVTAGAAGVANIFAQIEGGTLSLPLRAVQRLQVTSQL